MNPEELAKSIHDLREPLVVRDEEGYEAQEWATAQESYRNRLIETAQLLLDKYDIREKVHGIQYLKGNFVQLDGDSKVIQKGKL